MSAFSEKLATFVRALELLRSPVEGEVVAAAAAATRLLQSMGFGSYAELFSALVLNCEAHQEAEPPPQEPPEKVQPKTSAAQDKADRQYADLSFRISNHDDFSDMFNEKERTFIEAMAVWPRSFTPKMRAWLDSLGTKIGLKLEETAGDADARTQKKRRRRHRRKPTPHDRDEKQCQEHFRSI